MFVATTIVCLFVSWQTPATPEAGPTPAERVPSAAAPALVPSASTAPTPTPSPSGVVTDQGNSSPTPPPAGYVKPAAAAIGASTSPDTLHLAKDTPPPARFLPLVSVSGTTDKEGELKVAPSIYLAPARTPKVGFLIAPILKASTKSGAVEVPLTRIADTPGLGFGGSLSFYGLYSDTAAPVSSCSDADESPWSAKYCDRVRASIALCERAVGWNQEKNQGTNCADENKGFCEARKETELTFQLAPNLCPVGKFWLRTWEEGQPEFQEHVRRQYPKFVFTIGAAAQPVKLSYLVEEDASWTKQQSRAWTVDAGTAGAFMTKRRWRPGLQTTLEFTASYAGRPTAASKTGKWCVPENRPFVAGQTMATIETCEEAPLGAPARSHQLSASFVVGAIDLVKRRYRAGVGLTAALAPYQSYFVGVEAPFLIRLTPEAWKSYAGGYSGMLRIRPVVGALGSAGGVSFRAFIVVELQALRSLFGDRAFAWL